jgi:uncharacterized protein (TIGR03435 family)
MHGAKWFKGFVAQRCSGQIRMEISKSRTATVKIPAAGNRHFCGKQLSIGTGIVTIATLIVFGVVNAPRLRAQSTGTTGTQTTQPSGAPSPSFEVVSIKPNISGDPNRGYISFQTPGSLTATQVTTRLIIRFAYNIKDFQLSGGPGWINSEAYDIDAKVDDSLAVKLAKLPTEQRLDQNRLMVQSLLADRFKLSVTRSTRELPVYALVVAKGGPKLKDVTPGSLYGNAVAIPPTSERGSAPSPPPGRGTNMSIGRDGEMILTAKSVSIANLLGILSQQLGRQILDRTGLKGTYDFTLQYLPEKPVPGLQGPGDTPPPDSSGTSIFTAIQEQLGLRLESTKGPVDVIVIDHIEEPSPN